MAFIEIPFLWGYSIEIPRGHAQDSVAMLEILDCSCGNQTTLFTYTVKLIGTVALEKFEYRIWFMTHCSGCCEIDFEQPYGGMKTDKSSGAPYNSQFTSFNVTFN